MGYTELYHTNIQGYYCNDETKTELGSTMAEARCVQLSSAQLTRCLSSFVRALIVLLLLSFVSTEALKSGLYAVQVFGTTAIQEAEDAEDEEE